MPPAMIALGRCRRASSRTWSRSTRPSSSRTPYPTNSNQRPEKFAREPQLRWPPCSSDIASTTSPGFNSAAYAASIAEVADRGWTLACAAENSDRARSTASSSAASASAQPVWWRLPG